MQFSTACTNPHTIPSLTLVADRIELQRLILQIERDVVAQANLRTLLAAADATVVGHRHELRTVQARIKRQATKSPGVLAGKRA